jgi:predicted AAA+ superfamily ATPase
MDSFLISEAKRYDVKGKTYFKFPYKYYYTDTGLRNARLNYRQDISHNYFDDNGIFHCSLIDFLLERVELF